MKKKLSKFLAVILSMAIVISPVTAYAESSREDVAKRAKIVDCLLETVLDPVFNVIINSLMKAESISNRYPSAEEYFSEEQPYFYEGTDGKVTGNGWKMGYASSSVIPLSWRENASGKQDDNGMNLNKTYYFGGYFGSKVNKIYDDETVNLAVLSAGTDSNNNGVEDILIFAALDNIGMSNGNIRKVRKAVSEKLGECGVADDDIIAFNFSCTHAHTVVEALGMSLNTVFFRALINHFLFRRDTSVNRELLRAICENTASSAAKAYKSMEKGNLSFFETQTFTEYMDENGINKKPEDRQMAYDKLKYGADCQDTFTCWYFEGESGEKTVIANTGMHPTFAGRNSQRVCADYPYYLNKALQEKGYNSVFLQGSQAAVAVTGYYTQEGSDWAEKNTLSKDEWAERYGTKYADEHYSEEADYFELKATSYSLAQIVVDGISRKQDAAPSIEVKMQQAVIPLDYDIMYLGGISGVFGYNIIRTKGTETGYSLVTEIGYVNLGDNVTMLMLPGEVSPAITFGKSEKYTGEESWSGKTSWSGEEWDYKTLKEMAQEKFGPDTKVIASGLTNDEIGYVMPDTDCADNFLTKSLISDMGYHVGRANNEELMSASKEAGSSLVEAFAELLETNAKK